MQTFDPKLLKKLYTPSADSHKGQNGKLLIIGGSHLFHASTLWALEVASRIVDMVFYASVPENNKIVLEAKKAFHNGIVIPREQIENYIEEAACILIGPGMLRTEKITSEELTITSLEQITNMNDEGKQSYFLTKYLLEKYPQKKWVIDAGALQMLEPELLLPLQGNVIVTPHEKELEKLFNFQFSSANWRINFQSKINNQISNKTKIVSGMAKKYNCIILLKGQKDIVCSPTECLEVSGGNAGMTKGGTGDVLAGLVAALACNNDLFLSAACGSYINKKAGEKLYERVSYYFNASDLVTEIPKVMKELLL